MLIDEQRTRLMHEARKSRRWRQAQMDRIADDVQRGKATRGRSGGVIDEGPQAEEIQKEGGSRAKDQDPGGSEGDGSEQNIV